MKKSLVWIPLIVLVLLAGILGKVLANGHDPEEIASPLIGDSALALNVPAFGEDGKRVTMEDLRGKRQLVNFFASWCGPCAAENKLLLDMAHDYHIRIVGIAMKDNAGALQEYLDKHGSPYAKIGLDETGHTAIDWGVSGVPETFVIDGKGTIIERHIGQLDGAEARHLIDLLKDAS